MGIWDTIKTIGKATINLMNTFNDEMQKKLQKLKKFS